MKRLGILLLAAMTVGAQAQQGAPPDVPRNHWAYPAVDDLFKAGLLKGYPDGTFKGSRPASRYEMAALLAKVNIDLKTRLDAIQAQIDEQKTNPQGRQELESRLSELRKEIAELQAMRADVSSLTERMSTMREQMATLHRDLGEMHERVGRIKG